MARTLNANPDTATRTEYDDRAGLFDPDGGKGGGVSPAAALIRQKPDGARTREQIPARLVAACEDGRPECAAADDDGCITGSGEKGCASV